jgi:hypothetical protein
MDVNQQIKDSIIDLKFLKRKKKETHIYVRFEGAVEALVLQEGEEAPLAEPLHAGILRRTSALDGVPGLAGEHDGGLALAGVVIAHADFLLANAGGLTYAGVHLAVAVAGQHEGVAQAGSAIRMELRIAGLSIGFWVGGGDRRTISRFSGYSLLSRYIGCGGKRGPQSLASLDTLPPLSLVAPPSLPSLPLLGNKKYYGPRCLFFFPSYIFYTPSLPK